MKYLITLTILATLFSCGKDVTNVNPTTVETITTNETPNESILNKFEAIGQGLHGIQELDYSQVQLGVPTVDTYCDGSYGNNGKVNGVSPGTSVLYGSTDFGYLQFGHLKYVGASLSVCADLSKERYSYQMRGNILTLCMVNYPYCADYKVVE